MGFKLPEKSITEGTVGHKKAVEVAKTSPAKGLMDNLQTALTGAGMIPIIGNVADAANVAVSGGRAYHAKKTGDTAGAKKHMLNMGINAAAMVPGAGLAVGGAKLAGKAAKGAKALKAAGKTGEAAEAVAKGQKLKNQMKTGEQLVRGGAKIRKGDKVASDTTELVNQGRISEMQPKEQPKKQEQPKKEGKVTYDQAWEKADKGKYKDKEEFTKAAKDWNKKQAEKKAPKKEAPKKEAPKQEKPKLAKKDTPKKSKPKKSKDKKGDDGGLFKKNKA